MDERFTQIKNKLITLDIHDKSFRIACYLISCSKNKICYPSEYTISKELHMSRNKVHECLLELQEKNVIKIEHRTIGEGKKASNKYSINKKYIVTKRDKEKLIETLTDDIQNDIEKVELFDYDWLNEGDE